MTRTGHTHFTRDIKSPGICPACDRYREDLSRSFDERPPHKTIVGKSLFAKAVEETMEGQKVDAAAATAMLNKWGIFEVEE